MLDPLVVRLGGKTIQSSKKVQFLTQFYKLSITISNPWRKGQVLKQLF